MKTTERVERKQSKHRRGREKRLLGRKYLQLGLSLIRGRASELAPIQGQSGLAISQSTLFCSRRVFWVKDASVRGIAAHVWATGFGGFFSFKIQIFIFPATFYSSVSVHCPFSLSPLATSFLLTSPLSCSLGRPHVRAPTPQVCCSASRARPLPMLLPHFSSLPNFSLNSSFSFCCLLNLFFSVVLLSAFTSKSEQTLLLEEGSETDPLDESTEDDPSGEEENILY